MLQLLIEVSAILDYRAFGDDEIGDAPFVEFAYEPFRAMLFLLYLLKRVCHTAQPEGGVLGQSVYHLHYLETVLHLRFLRVP